MRIYQLQMTLKVIAGYFLLNSLAARATVTDTNSVPATNAAPRLVIVKAVYGDLSDSSATADVTKIVADKVKDNAVFIEVNNDNFDDPASGVTKQLKVDFTIDGVAGSKSVYERGKLKLSLQDKPDPAKNSRPPKLVIRKAVYGALPDGDTIDVTSIVAGMVSKDALKMDVNNDCFGDPAVEVGKKLRVDYTLNGNDGTKTVEEGKTLTITGDSQ
jgi:hypothetical protein